MKQCPVCKTTYSDDSLSFCLSDGVGLVPSETNDFPTQQFSPESHPIRVTIPHDEPKPVVPPQLSMNAVSAPPAKSGSGLVIGLLIALLLLVVVGSVGVIGWLLIRDGNKNIVATNKNNERTTLESAPSPLPTIMPSTTPNEQDKLKEKIANLEKQVQQQKSSRDSVPTLPNTTPQSTKTTARANSPGDGFLALRTAPSTEVGERILQIPHGATLTVLGCQPPAKRRTGRWCRVEYNGYSGWAFDGYMTYNR